MKKISGSQRPSFRLRFSIRLIGGTLSLLLLLGIISYQDGTLLSTLQGIWQVESSDDFDGDGVIDIEDIDDDNDGIPDAEEGCLACSENLFANGDFETGPFPGNYTQVKEQDVEGWETSAPDNRIEIWKSGFYGVPSQKGSYHVEINSSHHAALYQVFCTQPGSQLHWSIWHRGRAGVDVAIVRIGSDLATASVQDTMTTGKSAWVRYTGAYTVPEGQTNTYLIFESVSTAGGNISVGNFIDNVEITGNALNLCLDSDQDGLTNQVDLDSDSDGILDIIEAGGTDANGDGMADDLTDVDGDGLVDLFDNDPTDGPLFSGCTLGTDCDLSGSTSRLFDTDGDGLIDNDRDTDSDGYPDFQDIDSDADGIVDNVEAQPSNGYTAPTGYDDDADGIDNAYDPDCAGGCTASDGTSQNINGGNIILANTDGGDDPDYRDTDADNDTEPDWVEAYDLDNDGTADTHPLGSDTDQDGLDDAFDVNDLALAPAANASNTGQTPGSFPDDDPSQAGGEPDWRDTPGTFPVEWLSFEVTASQGDALISWSTATETNSDYFDLERSTDGTSFESIGTEPGMGTTQEITEYEFVDRGAAATSSPRLFYRLRQVDLDGAFSYSSVTELSLEDDISTVEIVLAPNPASSRVSLRYAHQSASHIPLYILSLTGQQVYQGTLPQQSGELTLDVSNWPPGTYFVKIEGQQKAVGRLLVQR